MPEDLATAAIRAAAGRPGGVSAEAFDDWLDKVRKEARVDALTEEVRWFTAALHNSETQGFTVQHREGFNWAVRWLKRHLQMNEAGTITYGVYTRRDGLEVRFRRDTSQTDPDLQLRFDAYPAKCGCYPTNTDDREWVCEHGARWTRLMVEPFGLPIEPEASDAD